MHDFERGFRIDGVLIEWGTTLADAAGVGSGKDDAIHHTTYRARCSKAYGFETLVAEMSGQGPSRPVTSVGYELAPQDDVADPDSWKTAISQVMGAPSSEAVEDLSDRSNPWDAVRYYATWNRRDYSVSLSVYGAPRRIPEGSSAGMLWVNWSTTRAAEPYLTEWKAACECLAVAARGADDVRIFTVGFDQHAHYGYNSTPQEMRQREASLALSAPEILLTPKPIGGRLSARQFALWSNPIMKLHCLSTRTDSVIWDQGAALEASWWHVLPAKGPGQSALHVGRWSVADYPDSTSVPAAVAALEAIPGVTVKRGGGYDC